MFETSLQYKSLDLFQSTHILNSSNSELKQSKHLSPRRTAVQKVTCIKCDHEHNKADRIKKAYGILTTNHCPKCNCESFWLI